MLQQYLPAMLKGMFCTIELVSCALAVGILLAIIMAFVLTLKKTSRWCGPFKTFIFVFRGTPVLIQIVIIYYGLGQFVWLQHSVLWPLLKQPFFCAVMALGLNTAAYTTELLVGSIRAIPKGQVAACYAMGMSTWLMYRRIILPHAMRLALPAYSNEVIMVLKATSLASAITLLELTGTAQSIIGQTYMTIPFLLLAGGFYLLLNSVFIGVFKWVEHCYGSTNK
ncbi:MAG: ABC transporter permease subunit [Gammaproteobacteria bacterium]|nr:ABC transporter permease subunit [Gammaproteobacteria bacterium]